MNLSTIFEKLKKVEQELNGKIDQGMKQEKV